MDVETEELKEYTRPEDCEDNGTEKNESVKMKSFKEDDEESEKVNASIGARDERQTMLDDNGEPSQSDDNNEKDYEDKQSIQQIIRGYESNDDKVRKEKTRQSKFDSTPQKEGSNQTSYTKKITDGNNVEKAKTIGKNPRCNINRKCLKYSILAGGIVINIALLITVILCFTTKQQQGSYEEEQFSGPQNDPFFSTAFPQHGSTVIIKCFLSFQGKYTLHTIFEKENKNSNVSDICSTGDKKHHYKLYCDKDHNTGCKDRTVCRNNCAKFNISLYAMDFILLEMDDSCLALNGRIEIWNSTIKHTR